MNSDFKLWVPFPCDDLAKVIPIKINDPSKCWDGVPMNHTCSTMPPMHPAMSPGRHRTDVAMSRPMLARAQLHSALLALAVGLVPGGCGDESACASITDAGLWTDPPSGPLCVLGDLNVVGRRPDELTVLAQVEAVEGSIVIHDNPALVELPLWPALTRVGASLSISANPALTTVRGFPALTRLGEALYVAENPALVELRFADGVSTVGDVFIALNPRLTMLEGLAPLESVDGDLMLVYNDALEDVPLPALREVLGSLRLEGNASLRSVTMPALRTIGENWDIVNEDARDSLSDFASLERVGWATIEGNSSIKKIEWPASLEVIRMLSIVANDGLEELTGAASGARETSTEWRIVDNPSLTRITGFVGTTRLANLIIEGNEVLAELSAWPDLVRITVDLRVLRNPLLADPVALFPALTTAEDMWIFENRALAPAIADDLQGRVVVETTPRIGDNAGEDTALAPCPWSNDVICDAAQVSRGIASQLCAKDPEDCSA